MVIYMVIWTLLYPVVPGPQTTVIADTPVEVFRLSRADYDAVLRELPEERQASTLAQTVTVDEGGAIIPHCHMLPSIRIPCAQRSAARRDRRNANSTPAGRFIHRMSCTL